MLKHLEQLEPGTILIFHCEFSSVRAPKMAHFVRQQDRARNSYPDLSWPELYIMQGGYKEFYQNHSLDCSPKAYTPMDHPEYTQEYLVAKKIQKREKCNKIN